MADKKYYIMNTVWEVWSNSDHKTNYSFGLYDSKPTADEVYRDD